MSNQKNPTPAIKGMVEIDEGLYLDKATVEGIVDVADRYAAREKARLNSLRPIEPVGEGQRAAHVKSGRQQTDKTPQSRG